MEKKNNQSRYETIFPQTKYQKQFANARFTGDRGDLIRPRERWPSRRVNPPLAGARIARIRVTRSIKTRAISFLRLATRDSYRPTDREMKSPR